MCACLQRLVLLLFLFIISCISLLCGQQSTITLLPGDTTRMCLCIHLFCVSARASVNISVSAFLCFVATISISNSLYISSHRHTLSYQVTRPFEMRVGRLLLCWRPLCPHVDHRSSDVSGGLPSQRRVHSHPSTGRAQGRRADAVQVQGETLPRPLLRQQTQLVRSLAFRETFKYFHSYSEMCSCVWHQWSWGSFFKIILGYLNLTCWVVNYVSYGILCKLT